MSCTLERPTRTQAVLKPAFLSSIVEPLLLVVLACNVVSFVHSQLALDFSLLALDLSAL